jgi:hypothetical protein
MATTLTDMLTNVRSLLDEPNPQFWSDAELTSWINEACSNVARKIEWKRAEQDISVTGGTQQYTAPTDMIRIYRITFTDESNTNTYTVEWRGMMEMDQIWGINQEWPANYPLYYTTWLVPPALNLILYPVPSEDGTLQVYYYEMAVPAVSGSDDVDILEGYDDIVIDYTLYRALRKDADPRWAEFKQTYEDKLTDLYDNSRTFQDQAGTFTTGQAALPEWLVSDGLY